jgi:predicted ATPase/class 3 adenylate cyclase
MRVGLLGPLIVTGDDGAEWRLPGAAKQRAILTVLALRAPKTVSVSTLIEGVWGEDPPRTASKTLQAYMSGLRQVLPAGTIETVGGGYRLAVAAEDLDVARFEQQLGEASAALAGDDGRAAADLAAGALGWWRGDPLGDLADSPWAAAEITRLVELRHGCEEQLFDARLAIGEHAGLVGDLEAAVVAEPLRERRWAQLMVALYRAGRQADALRAFQRLRRVLGDQLGLDPSEDLARLEQAIIQHDPSLSGTASQPPAEPPGTIPRRGLPAGNVTFVFTDVEGSTRLFRHLGDRYPPLLDEYRRVMRAAVSAHDGCEVKTEGDGFFLAFGDAAQAVAACVDAQQALAGHSWPADGQLRVRMGVHTGIATPTPEGDYMALAVHQAARLAAAGHGGQILLSAQTEGLLRQSLPPETSTAEIGRFLLKDFDEAEQLFQILHADLPSTFPPLRAAPAMAHNLPDVRTTFVGRAQELAAVDELVKAGRLVTVTGPGGAGKTRLCVELAARLAPSFQAGAPVSDLSPLTDPSLVPATIAAAFGVRPAGGVDLLGAVSGELAGQRALLVVDNCEHLLDAAAMAVDRLLLISPGLRVIATSREPLGVRGEQIWRIPPLAVPDQDAAAETVRQSEAARLFEDRARLTRPDFAISSENAAMVASICRHLEGLPLAVELTAARVSAMSPSAIAARLDSQAHRLVASPRSAGRHRSLEATIDWSYQLLDDTDRRMLRTLSVFAGGFTAEAVEAVADMDGSLEHLAGLVDKSLVVYDSDVDRYRLLETIRAFARARLQQAGEEQAAAARHLRWCATFAQWVWQEAHTSKEAQTFARVDQEIDNVRVGAGWAERHADVNGLTVIGRLDPYWHYRAPVEGRAWAERLLQAIPSTDPVLTGMVMVVEGVSAFVMGDREVALGQTQRAVAVLRTADDADVLIVAMVLHAMALAHLDRAESKALSLEAYHLAVKTGHAAWECGILCNLCATERGAGNFPAALEYAERGMAALSRADVPPTIHVLVLGNLGITRLDTGTPPVEVHSLFVESIDWAAQTRSPMILAWTLEALAHAVVTFDPDGAARLLGADLALRRIHGIFINNLDRFDIDNARRQIELRIGPTRTAELMDSIDDISIDQAIQLARTLAT